VGHLYFQIYERLEARGHLDAMLARYGTLRQYLPAFLALPFQAAAGSETLLRAIESLRALDAGTRGALTTDDPRGFVPAAWRSHLVSDGKLDRAIREISLPFAVRDALRAGGLFLAHSRDHVSFWNLVDLPADGQMFLARIAGEFDRAARAAARGLPSNRFAAIRDGRLALKRRDALPVSRVVRELRATIGASLPRVRIEDLLQDADEWCGFTGAFEPLGGYQPGGADPHRSTRRAPSHRATMRGNGAAAWFGWAEDPELEELRESWLDATDSAKRHELDAALQVRAFKSVPFVPLGQYMQSAAWRSNLAGLLRGPAPLFWNVAKG
jgi:hypothetical protein